MTVQRNIAIGQSKSKPVIIDIFTPDKGSNFETVVFFHGTRGFKDWGAWQYMHPYFNHAGLALVTVNFSHNGVNFQTNEFDDAQAYGENTISLELAEIKMVLDWLEQNAEEWKLRPGIFHLIGHSRAGGEVIVYANRDARVDKVIVWAPVTDFLGVYSDRDRAKWKSEGFIETINSRTGQVLPVNYSFVVDVETNDPEYQIVAAASMIEKPLLLIHGEKDESVPVQCSLDIYDSCLHALMVTIPEAGHTFGISHPWTASRAFSPTFVEVLDNTIEFITG